jgi:uncharacterized protein (UPF0261 family)
MGGSGGTLIGTSAMRSLPLGFPKLMVSTSASGNTSAYVGTSDLVMMPAVVDIAGLNPVSRLIFANAAGAICGMASGPSPERDPRPALAATMIGNTTPAVDRARHMLEVHGYAVLVFHANGGGRAMEGMIADGAVSGVLDLTTTELSNELCGGVRGAGPERLEAAARAGRPQVVAPGGLDLCNFWSAETVPERYRGRRFYAWSPAVTLMRTTPEENARLGTLIADKLNAASGPAQVFIPLGGFSQLSSPGQPFWWPEADSAFHMALKGRLRADIPIHELPQPINDPAFADQAAAALLNMLARETPQ